MAVHAQLAVQIRKLHGEVIAAAKQSVHLAIQCGALLTRARGYIAEGTWEIWLDGIGLNKITAWRYMRVAAAYESKSRQLQEGAGLCDLYRELGLIRPLQGGGRRLGKAECDRRNAARQLLFNFDVFEMGIKEVIRHEDNPFRSIARDQLAATRADTARALALMDEALGEEAIEV